MARAPARLAPSINVWLRGFGAGCVTANLLALSTARPSKKLKAITLAGCWPEIPLCSWLGHHHPLGSLRTATELIRTTTRAARSAGFAEILRRFVMATWSISIATENNRMRVLGQSVKLILVWQTINYAYSVKSKLSAGHLWQSNAHLSLLEPWDPRQRFDKQLIAARHTSAAMQRC